MLAKLISPVSPEEFFDAYWEQKPLHIQRSASGFYNQLLTRADVDSVIAAGGLRHPSIQLAKGGLFLPPEAFTRTGRSGVDVFSGIPDLDEIAEHYRSGATITLPAFHRAWKPLQDLVTAVDNEFNHPAHANVYVTPGNAKGFAPHYDTHEIFVLQVSGQKRWWIEPPTVPLPHRSQPFQPPATPPPGDALPAANAIEIELVAGDLLYLPRGFVHTTATSDAASIHVTLGITVYTWVELLAEWVQSSRGGHSFRRALPPGFADRADLRAALGKELSALVAELQGRSDYDGLVDAFSHNIRNKFANTQQTFRSDIIVIGLSTQLVMPPPSQYSLTEEYTKLVLRFNGKTLHLPLEVHAMINDMRLAGIFQVASLTLYLDRSIMLELARTLHSEGFLTLGHAAADKNSSP